MRVYGMLTLVMALLQRERRVSYWALKQEFGLDDAFIEGLKQELIVAKRVAIDEGGQVLIWTGEVLPPATPAVVQSTPIEAAVTLPPPVQTLPPQAHRLRRQPRLRPASPYQCATPLRPNAARSRCCSATWSTRRSCPSNSMPKTTAPWCVPTRRRR